MSITQLIRSAVTVALLLGWSSSLLAQDAKPKPAVPSDDARKEAEDTIAEVYGQEFEQAKKREQKQAFAKDMILKGDETTDELAAQYEMFRIARRIAIGIGDAELAMEAVTCTVSSFDVDELDLKASTLRELSRKKLTKANHETLALHFDVVIADAVAADRFDIATNLTQLALDSAKKTGKASIRELAVQRRKDIKELAGKYVTVKKALDTLEKRPVNNEANGIVGRYLCFDKGNWEQGLSYLALANDESISELAEQELSDDPDSLALGDGWWEVAANEKGLAKKHIQLRAAYRYRQVLRNLDGGLIKARVEKRLKAISTVAIAFPLGQWVDVLSRVDVTEHALEGRWTKRGQDIVVSQRKTACRLIVPVAPVGDYDFEIQFSRVSGIPANWHTSVAIIPIGSSSCCIWFNTEGPSGIDRIYGRRPNNNGNPTSLRITMKNGRRYTAVISVRYHRNEEATIRASLNGKKLFDWRGPVNAFSPNPDWGHRWPNTTLGLGAFCTETVFHAARLRMVSGEALDVKNTKQAKMPMP